MGTLTLVGTPIGNTDDISFRVLKTLFNADVILAEDTRNWQKLKRILIDKYAKFFQLYEINTEKNQYLISYRDQNHSRVTPKILSLLQGAMNICLVSDAGMPLISDPGYKLLNEVLKRGIEVEIIPGPTAIDTALVISGLPTDKFTFLGFMPREKGKIKKLLTSSSHIQSSIIFYESPFRILKTLEIISDLNPETQVAACNDLTKKFQKVIRGDVKTVIAELKRGKIQGEWVVVMNAKI